VAGSLDAARNHLGGRPLVDCGDERDVRRNERSRPFERARRVRTQVVTGDSGDAVRARPQAGEGLRRHYDEGQVTAAFGCDGDGVSEYLVVARTTLQQSEHTPWVADKRLGDWSASY